MNRYTLNRDESDEQGTYGKLIVNGNVFETIELPWKDNEHGKSCIPIGVYTCQWSNSPAHGWLYQVMAVPDRDNILIGHKGNWAGDVDSGYRSDFLGCIGLGTSRAVLSGQKAIAGSAIAVSKFLTIMNQDPFELEIV